MRIIEHPDRIAVGEGAHAFAVNPEELLLPPPMRREATEHPRRLHIFPRDDHRDLTDDEGAVREEARLLLFPTPGQRHGDRCPGSEGKQGEQDKLRDGPRARIGALSRRMQHRARTSFGEEIWHEHLVDVAVRPLGITRGRTEVDEIRRPLRRQRRRASILQEERADNLG